MIAAIASNATASGVTLPIVISWTTVRMTAGMSHANANLASTVSRLGGRFPL